MCDLKKCENCDNDHDGNYGSGRFCSSKCARGFSTKNKRSLINEKVSLKLTKEKIIINKICINCNNNFDVFSNNKNKKTCSISCASAIAGKAIKKDTSKMGGIREGGGRSKLIEYTNYLGEKMKLNKEEILVAQILDILKLTWNRNFKGFIYFDNNNKKRKFYPDFYIKEYDLYLEYKGWITDKMKYKMDNAKINNNFNLFILYGNDKRYNNLGINLNELINNPNLLKYTYASVAKLVKAPV